MKLQEIYSNYRALYHVESRPEKIRKLQILRSEAEKHEYAGLPGLIDARIAGCEDRYGDSVNIIRSLLQSFPLDQELKAWALINRGIIYAMKGETEKGIADLIAVIDGPAAPADLKAEARFNRGVVYGQQGEPEKEIADYTAVMSRPA